MVRNALLLLVFLLPVGAWVGGSGLMLSILLGGLLGLVHFHWTAVEVDRLLRGEGIGGGKAAIRYILRLLLIFGGLFAIIHLSFLSLIGALLGLSVFVLSGLVEAFLQLFGRRA